MIPRSVKRKLPKPPALPPPLPPPPPAAATSPSAPARSAPTPAPSTSRAPPPPPPPSPAEAAHLGTILVALEEGLSDWGLSTHRKNGLLAKVSEAQGANEGYVHLQLVLGALQHLRALTTSVVELSKALRLRGGTLELHPDGFQLRRKSRVNLDELDELSTTDWELRIVYIENIPPPPHAHALSPLLTTLIATPPQKTILPPLYNPTHPPPEAHPDHEPAALTQRAAFSQAVAPATPRRALPPGGGPFKGFALVLLRTEAEVKRVCREWRWDASGEGKRKGGVQVEVESVEGGGEPEEGRDNREGARRLGMRALPYTRFVALKAEYLAYQRTLHALNKAQAEERSAERHSAQHAARPPGGQKQSRRDRQREHQRQAAEYHGHAPPATPVPDPPPKMVLPAPPIPALPLLAGTPATKRGPGPAPSSDAMSPPLPKRARLADPPGRAHPPSTPDLHRQPATLTPSSAGEAATAWGGFPKGCVVWLRNVHEKSSRTTLRSVFAKVLEKLEEGSGRGVEYADYEKGLDTSYIRFSAPHLSTLLLSHLAARDVFHVTPQQMYTKPSPDSDSDSDSSSSSSSSGSDSDNPAALAATRRPIIATLLEGDRERAYWEQLPEAARKGARQSAGSGIELAVLPVVPKKRRPSTHRRDGGGGPKGASKGLTPAGLEKAAKEEERMREELERKARGERGEKVEEMVETGTESEREGEGGSRKRKKAGRF